jgi:hypothetical protein
MPQSKPDLMLLKLRSKKLRWKRRCRFRLRLKLRLKLSSILKRSRINTKLLRK